MASGATRFAEITLERICCHAALHQVLGTHVKQAGSAVHPDRLRFDFSHFAQVADEELEEIESIVNREVLANAKVETLEDVPIDVAVNEYHAMALFGEKYGDKVRVVKLSDGFSTELCGGTHTNATGRLASSRSWRRSRFRQVCGGSRPSRVSVRSRLSVRILRCAGWARIGRTPTGSLSDGFAPVSPRRKMR